MEKADELDIKNSNFEKGIARGDAGIIRQVYSKYFDSIAQYILNNKGTIEDAKDIFQDAMMIIYQKFQEPNFKLQYSLHTYLYTICRNTWLKKIRKKSDMGVPLPDNLELIEDDNFDHEILWRQKEKLYREKFKELSEGCQKVLQMALAKVTMEQIAEKMGFAGAGYAKKRKYKCKNQLLKLIQNDRRFQNLKII
ncbi:MAG: RNA polymerase sigma factor [Saprospiraceae bacterium]